MDGKDLELILKSNVLNISEKNKFFKNVSESIIISNDNNFVIISDLLLQNENLELSDTILENTLLNKTVKTEKRIDLFNKQLFQLHHNFINKFLVSLEKPFDRITLKNRKAKIPRTDRNLAMLEILEDENYISSISTSSSNLRVNHKRK